MIIILCIVTILLLTAFLKNIFAHLMSVYYIGVGISKSVFSGLHMLSHVWLMKTRLMLAFVWPNCTKKNDCYVWIRVWHQYHWTFSKLHQWWSDDLISHLNIVLISPEVVLCWWREEKLALKVTVTHHTPSYTHTGAHTHTHPSFLSLSEGNSPHRCNQTYCFDLLWALQLLRG